MKRKTMLEKAIAGRTVVAYVEGKCAPFNKNSNLYKEAERLGLLLNDYEISWDVAVGAARRNFSDGYRMAIVLQPGYKLPARKIDIHNIDGSLYIKTADLYTLISCGNTHNRRRWQDRYFPACEYTKIPTAIYYLNTYASKYYSKDRVEHARNVIKDSFLDCLGGFIDNKKVA